MSQPQTIEKINRKELSDILSKADGNTIVLVEYGQEELPPAFIGFFERLTPEELILCSHYQSLNALLSDETMKEKSIKLADIKKIILYDINVQTPYYQIE
ncbi:hypothetical protein GF358_00210 [Candidatus Woesearchaeota archaeon]|nr:hypothetical protein [Candidatus Woesearchaeota archaeon]